MKLLEPFAGPIGEAARDFPLVAALIALPFAALHYRRYGRVHPWRALAAYSFAFYLLTALFLVLLPLPDLPAKSAGLADWEARFGRLRHPQLDPTAFIRDIAAAQGPRATARAVLQAAFNLLLLFPFGAYLVWLFRCRLPLAATLGLALSLFFETCQLTGIFWIYPGPFRLFDTGDLLLNATGSFLGALSATALMKKAALPDLELTVVPSKPWIGAFRRSCAFALDFLAFLFSSIALSIVFDLVGLTAAIWKRVIPAAVALGYLVILPALDGGRGVGKRLMLCATRKAGGGDAPGSLILLRQALLWVPPPLAFLLDYWLPGGAISPTPYGWAFAGWCLAWAINATSAIFHKEAASFLDRALGLRVRNTWSGPAGPR